LAPELSLKSLDEPSGKVKQALGLASLILKPQSTSARRVADPKNWLPLDLMANIFPHEGRHKIDVAPPIPAAV